MVGTGSGAALRGRRSGFCASTGPCARELGVAVGSGRLQVVPLDWAPTGPARIAASAVEIAARAMIEFVPLMVSSVFAKLRVNPQLT
jgi:hypothetical protein